MPDFVNAPVLLIPLPSKIRTMRRAFRIVAAGSIVAAIAFAAQGDAQQAQQPSQQQPADQPPADPQPPAGQPPVFRAGINFVRVDVIVSDKSGVPVADLKQTDFEVLEDGKPQTVETFKMIKLDGGAMPTPDGPPRQIRTDLDEEILVRGRGAHRVEVGKRGAVGIGKAADIFELVRDAVSIGVLDSCTKDDRRPGKAVVW